MINFFIVMDHNLILKSNNWKEFKTTLEPLNNTEEGRIFEELTRLYLLTEPTFSTKIEEVWHHSDVPQKIIDELGLQQPEIGVDLIAQIKDGTYWAIQCKYHEDQNRNVSYKELSTFLSITERDKTYPKLSHRLVCTSANEISRRVQKAHPEKLGYLTSADFSKLGNAEFETFRDLLGGESPLPMPFSPKPHQSKAIDNCFAFFKDKNNARGKIIHPCGSGKSLMGYWIAEKLQSKTILLAVPSLALVRQTLSTWTREAVANGIEMDWIAVCSDEDVKSSDDPLMQRVDLGIEVNTDPNLVSEFLLNLSEGTKVIITTYQSGEVVSEGLKKSGKTFDLGIFDEAHKTVGQKDKKFAYLLYDENAKIEKRIFMTATERQFKGNSDEYLSMDDPEIYGTIIDELSFKEALEQKEPILSDYKIVTTLVTKSEIEELIQNNNFVKTDGTDWTLEGDASTFAALVALRKLIKERNIKHTVSFHNSIKRSKDFQKLNSEVAKIDDFGNLSSFHVSGKDSTGVRAAELERFVETEPSLITNARCLTEGVDVPAIDAVLFADAKQSKIDIVQAAGRALRKFEGKNYGYIIVPVVINDDTADASDDAFNQIITVISALGMNDSRIIEEYKLIANGIRNSNSIVEIDVPEITNINFEELTSNINIEIWNRLSFGWGKGFKRLKEYVDKNHHAFVPNLFRNEDGFRLGSWVQNRRHWFKAGKLSQDHIEQLESIEGWTWDVNEARFEEGISKLIKYVENFRQPNVPKDYIDEEGYKLGQWIVRQRKRYRDKYISLDQIKKLESFNDWMWDPQKEIYEKGLRQLEKFFLQYSNAKVPTKFIDKDGFALGAWVTKKRGDYRKGLLPEDRIKKLESLEGWTWDPEKDIFEEGFKKLKKYLKNNSIAKVPKGYIDIDGFKLGNFIQARRYGYKKGILPIDRIKKLESLEGWTWDPLEEDFIKGFEKIKKFIQENSHARVSKKYQDVEGFNLYEWVKSRRREYRRKKLHPDRIKKLESLKEWIWNQHDEKFLDGINALKKFIEKNNHIKIPYRYENEEGFKLGAWVTNRRREYSLGKLSLEKIKILESTNIWKWDSGFNVLQKEDKKVLHELKKFYEKYGHLKVPRGYRDKDGYNLYEWVSRKRKQFKKGEIPKNFIKEIESLKGWVWDVHENARLEGLKRLKKFSEKYGHANVPTGYLDEDGYDLNSWVAQQRKHFKKRTLNKKLLKELESIKGWVWDANDEAFLKGFEKLKEYYAKHGKIKISQKYEDEDGYKLGSWILSRRQEYSKGKLSLDRINKLESIKGWKWKGR